MAEEYEIKTINLIRKIEHYFEKHIEELIHIYVKYLKKTEFEIKDNNKLREEIRAHNQQFISINKFDLFTSSNMFINIFNMINDNQWKDLLFESEYYSSFKIENEIVKLEILLMRNITEYLYQYIEENTDMKGCLLEHETNIPIVMSITNALINLINYEKSKYEYVDDIELYNKINAINKKYFKEAIAYSKENTYDLEKAKLRLISYLNIQELKDEIINLLEINREVYDGNMMMNTIILLKFLEKNINDNSLKILDKYKENILYQEFCIENNDEKNYEYTFHPYYIGYDSIEIKDIMFRVNKARKGLVLFTNGEYIRDAIISIDIHSYGDEKRPFFKLSLLKNPEKKDLILNIDSIINNFLQIVMVKVKEQNQINYVQNIDEIILFYGKIMVEEIESSMRENELLNSININCRKEELISIKKKL